ncbi:hypothetical protein HOF56_04560 [Candidatus Peribacteria bacterium]|jgi:hypothetical protein|nr:hypothetical protein [Candidatus Peribacteria bacterium]MBT4021679.1 hypothetical protein [Candidatus Peribacteria bacterium]MBT4240841.1 hypothetical protein [Candidatus Peribacteria bacterium]MBT4473777.1 hypothetical protein [Candidatus Peribacteria bacterium]
MSTSSTDRPTEWYAYDVAENPQDPFGYPRFVVSVERQRLVDVLLNLMTTLREPLDIYLTVSQLFEKSRRDVREEIETSVLQSALREAEDLLLDDNCLTLNISSSKKEDEDSGFQISFSNPETGEILGGSEYNPYDEIVLREHKIIECYHEVQGFRARLQAAFHRNNIKLQKEIFWPEHVERERKQSHENAETYMQLCRRIGAEQESEW